MLQHPWFPLNTTFPTTERAFPEWTRNAVRVPFGSLREREAEYLEIERRRENDKMEAQEHRTALVGELVDIQAFVATHPELLNRVSYFTGWSSRRIDDEGAHPLGMLLACICSKNCNTASVPDGVSNLFDCSISSCSSSFSSSPKSKGSPKGSLPASKDK